MLSPISIGDATTNTVFEGRTEQTTQVDQTKLMCKDVIYYIPASSYLYIQPEDFPMTQFIDSAWCTRNGQQPMWQAAQSACCGEWLREPNHDLESSKKKVIQGRSDFKPTAVSFLQRFLDLLEECHPSSEPSSWNVEIQGICSKSIWRNHWCPLIVFQCILHFISFYTECFNTISANKACTEERVS